MKILQPDGWPRPSGYSNGILAEGRMLFVAGQVGWNARNEMTGERLVDQIRQALENIVSILKTGGAEPRHIVRMTWYVTNLDDYRTSSLEIGEVYRFVNGNHYPAMTLVRVAELLEDGAKVEIEATAVIPERR